VLAFTSVYFSESRFFNGLRALCVRFLRPISHLPEVFSGLLLLWGLSPYPIHSNRIPVISDFAKQMSMDSLFRLPLRIPRAEVEPVAGPVTQIQAGPLGLATKARSVCKREPPGRVLSSIQLNYCAVFATLRRLGALAITSASPERIAGTASRLYRAAITPPAMTHWRRNVPACGSLKIAFERQLGARQTRPM
jgi:hypothetical protein